MSIYGCIDAIETLINSEPIEPVGFFGRLLSKFGIKSTSKPLNEVDKNFLEELKKKLNLIIKIIERHDDPNTELETALEELKLFQLQTKSQQVQTLCLNIAKDLDVIKIKTLQAQAGPRNRPDSDTPLNVAYQNLMNSSLVHTKIRQGEMNSLGKSKGECYGITFSMADSRLSPYQHPGKNFDFNRTIHEYQKNQSTGSKDQQRIKRTRLTGTQFCPSLQAQAEQLYKFAENRKDQDLSIILYGQMGRHACYLRNQVDGKIRYMDPNHGAFLFNTKEEFISAYRLIYMKDNQPFHSYSISKLQEDIDMSQKESRTLGGKLRSLLTGPKYDGHSESLITNGVNMTLGAVSGAVIGATIGSVIPIIGTAVGGIIGGILGSMAGLKLTQMAGKNGHSGLLGVINYCREMLHSNSESIKKKLGITREKDVIPKMELPEQNKPDQAAENGVIPTIEPPEHSPDPVQPTADSLKIWQRNSGPVYGTAHKIDPNDQPGNMDMKHDLGCIIPAPPRQDPAKPAVAVIRPK